MKTLIKLFGVTLIAAVFVFTGCEDRTDLTAPKAPDTGNANFASFVAIGNSLTAGYQNSALYESGQEYSFGNLIAKQVGATYVQPLISDPGIGGRLEVTSLEPFAFTVNTTQGQPLNLNYSKPYNNLGVPGAWLVNMLQTKSTDTDPLKLNNPFFDIVLRGIGTPIQQAKMLHPTFVTFWAGNNDILGYASKGGTVPFNDPNTFAFLYSQAVDSLAQLGAKVVVANIPSVTSTPYFMTVGPQVGMAIRDAMRAGLAYGLFYQKNGQHGPADMTSIADTTALWTGKVILTLAGASYAALIGQPTGKFYRDYHIDPALVGVDTTKPFGLSPQNPYPDAFTLDPDELTTIANTINSYNTTIANLVAAHDNFALVDVNAFLNNVAANGIVENGVKFTTQYIEGGLFGVDGVHPTNQGYGLIANEFIKVINKKFNANIPLVDVSALPGGIIIGKKIKFNKYGIPLIPPHSLDNIVF